MKSFYGDLEKELLSDFLSMLGRVFEKGSIKQICGHNLKEFDIPYICRRSMIHGLSLPAALQLHGKKPWQLDHLVDTMELWKFGDYNPKIGQKRTKKLSFSECSRSKFYFAERNCSFIFNFYSFFFKPVPAFAAHPHLYRSHRTNQAEDSSGKLLANQ